MRPRTRAAVLLSCFAFASSTVATADPVAAAIARAQTGDAEGFYRLALVHEQGRGTARDLVEARRQYEKAAELGHVESQFALGLLLLGALPESEGARDEAKAFHWFEKAANQGHARAAFFLALSLESGVGTSPDLERAFDWYRRAAIRGEPQALPAVSRMYADGAGIGADLAHAHAWNQLALSRGVEGAKSFEAELEASMSPGQLERADALAEDLIRKYAASTGR